MKAKFTILALLLNILCLRAIAQIPLVYTTENTAGSCAAPPLPTLAQLPIIAPLPDPFVWSDGSKRSTSFTDWACRRNEIRREIENYEIGTKPGRPDTISASFAGTTLTIQITKNGQSMTLTAQVIIPSGVGPFPAVIGMNSASGSIPATIFSSRNIARITFSHDQVTRYNNPQLTDPFYRLYPEFNLNNSGQYSAWAWGVSRIIDGLELTQANLPIDLKHLAVTGCSYAGKMSLFAGAFDERIALTIAQESGGGGAPAWRVSETIGDVEKLGATSNQWFSNDMFQFAGTNVSKLPHDHHELMAMVAPRALLVTGNTDFTWLANPSAYVSARATKEIFKTLGIGDRFGFYIDGQHGHCAVPNSQVPAISAFVDKFLLGNTSVNTDTVTIHPYPNVDYERWYKWWGTNNPVFPPEPPSARIWMEAECATVGSKWDVLQDNLASNGRYVVVKSGLNSTASAPADTASAVIFNFTVDSAATYNFNVRLNCINADDDSYWIKVDNGSYVSINGLGTSGWQWVRLTSANLSVGTHAFSMAYREDGAKLDKLLVTTSQLSVNEVGTVGANCGQPPLIVPGQTFSVSEDATQNSLIGTVQASDADTAAVFQRWRITGGTGAGIFTIDEGNGQLTLLDSSVLDFESATRSYSMLITVTDGYFTSEPGTITVNVINKNDNIPAVPAALSFVLDAGNCNGIGVVNATDADDINAPGFTSFQDWKIVGGTGTDIFAINSQTGMITIANLNLVDFVKSNYTLKITVSDGVYTSAILTVTVTIPDKIKICHNGEQISVSKYAALAHIRHGDCIGACGPGVDYPALKVNISPNPTVNTFLVTIKSGNPTQPVTMNVYTLLGVLVEQKQNLQVGQSIKIGQNYKQGIYLVELKQGLDKEAVLVLKLR
ncbi:MAG: cadherin domain-containing protein [Sphingobacteriales bacterium]|nr:cadherin domain-containing protein [Sphingobacteriales bacterium]OJW00198.1 MAG: hypothetical protein BGO52_03685 [Sphingobacteriales bacterium 44-61]